MHYAHITGRHDEDGHYELGTGSVLYDIYKFKLSSCKLNFLGQKVISMQELTNLVCLLPFVGLSAKYKTQLMIFLQLWFSCFYHFLSMVHSEMMD